jgi:cobalt/nickel transport system permease protein
MRPQCKIVAALLFVFAVVATPREAFWAFGLYAIMLMMLAKVAGIPLRFIARRLVIEIPFVVFAVLMPFFGSGEKVEVLGLSLYVSGLWAAWNILAKATLGFATTIILGATTPVADLLHGLDHLKIPRAFTSIAAFMVRYLDVISSEMQRMKVARESRGYDPRWIWQARALAASAGALFIRSLERGERVYLAMLSRGYEGSVPLFHEGAASRRQWAAALTLPAAAALVASVAWMVTP